MRKNGSVKVATSKGRTDRGAKARVRWEDTDGVDEETTKRILRAIAIFLLTLALLGGSIYGLKMLMLGGKMGLAAAEPTSGPVLRGYIPAPRPATVPPIYFTNEDGLVGKLTDFTGKVVLLNLWATWCAPCVKELPSLDRLQGRLGGEEFQVLALSQDRGGRLTVSPFLDRLKLNNLPVYLDPEGKTLHDLGVGGLPTTFLIDRQGRALGRLEGEADWDSPEALRLIQLAIGKDTTTSKQRPGGIIKTGG